MSSLQSTGGPRRKGKNLETGASEDRVPRSLQESSRFWFQRSKAVYDQVPDLLSVELVVSIY